MEKVRIRESLGLHWIGLAGVSGLLMAGLAFGTLRLTAVSSRYPAPTAPAEKHDDTALHAWREHERELAATVAGLEVSRRQVHLAAERVIRHLVEKGEPFARSNQPQAYARQRAILYAQTQTRAFAADLTDYIATGQKASRDRLATSDSQFRMAMDAFRGLTRSRAGAAMAHEAERLFQGMAREVGVVSETVRRRDDQELALRAAADRLAAQKPLSPAPRVAVIANPINWHRPAAVMGFVYVIFAGVSFWWFRRRVLQGLAQLAQAAEAAAAGDLSREVQLRGWNEMSRVGLALNRLIGVLGRSENLVYHLATLVESSGDAIIGFNLDGAILSWNKGAQRMYGYAAEDVKGASISILTPGDISNPLEALMGQVRRGDKIKPLEMVHTGKSGRRVHAVVRIACILDSTRKVIGASLCAQDITAAGMLPPYWTQSTSQPTTLP